MLRIQPGNDDLDPELSEPRRQRRFFGADFHFQALVRQRPGFHILSGVEPGAGPQGNQQVFGRCHAAVRSAIIGRLVAHHAVTPRAGFELYISAVLNCDFHKSFHQQRCSQPAKVTRAGKAIFSGRCPCHLPLQSASFPTEALIQIRFMLMRTSLVFLLAVPLWAQDPLSLRDAVRLAIRENKAIAGTAAGAQASDARITQARGGMLPKINYSESFARSNNPVFVFSSLLTQHQFGVENFAIGPLNRPDFLNNFQSQVTVDQPIYDARQTRNAVKSAELAQKMTGEEQRLVQMNVISQAARAYYGAVLAAENLKAAEQAVRSAEADLKRAEAVRAAGMSTDVDVLSIRVHLAAVTEQRIDRAADVEVAKASLNDALGLPLDTPHTLTTPLEALILPDLALDGLESAASTGRPEAQQTRLATSLAQTQADGARSAMLPQVSFRGAFEADRQRFVDLGGANWLAAVSLRWNLFNGSADKARIAETTASGAPRRIR